MKLLIGIIALGLVTTSLQADTYNFIFSRPKKGQKAAPAETKKPAVEKEEPVEVPSPPVVTEFTPPPRRSWFRMGFSGVLVLGRIVYDNYTSYNKIGVTSPGGLVTLTFNTSTVFGISLLFGVERPDGNSAGPIFGLEFEVNPFSTDSLKYSTYEFNFLVGTNVGAASTSKDSSAVLHAGGRFIYNVNQRFGFTSAARFSTGGQMLELGLVTRL